jgi:hypothetical protein
MEGSNAGKFAALERKPPCGMRVKLRAKERRDVFADVHELAMR